MSSVAGMENDNGELRFEDYSRRYNFQNTAGRSRFFTSLLIQELEGRDRPRRVLDIGCGRGMARNVKWTQLVREHVEEFWGIEPDKDVWPEKGLFDHFQHAMMETAELPENHFDLAYSYMVMEHVAEPEPFLQAVHRTLKPGGRYYFITPNGRHYFALITRALKRLGLEELVLRVVMGGAVEEYHYPVQYRCNTAAAIDACAMATGFQHPQIIYVEQKGPEGYLRGLLRPVLATMNLKRRLLKNSQCLLNIVARIEKHR